MTRDTAFGCGRREARFSEALGCAGRHAGARGAAGCGNAALAWAFRAAGIWKTLRHAGHGWRFAWRRRV